MSQEHSAEWLRGAVAVLGRMVDDCSTVFDSDLPHITQSNLEDYLAEYGELLAAAEAREAGKATPECPYCHGDGVAESSNEAGDTYSQLCCCPLGEARRSREGLQKPTQPTAAEVIAGAKRAMEELLEALRDDMPLDAAITHSDAAVEAAAAWEAAQR